jgi:DNA-binding transcriptional LysR family regulator
MIEQEFITVDDPTSEPASTLYFLRTFHTVAALHSYTRAAQALHLGQPAVSAQIRSLERHYEARLFQVRGRRAHLTAEGEALWSYADRVFNLLRAAPAAVKASQTGDWGRLVLGASTTIGVYLLPHVLGHYAGAHPSVRVELAVGTTADVVGYVLSERVSFGLVEAPVQHAQLDVRGIGEDELILIAPPDHGLGRTGRVAGEALKTVPLLRREPGSGTQALVDTTLRQAGITMPTGMILGNTEALKQAVLERVGIAFVPLSTVARELATGELISVAIEGVQLRRTLSVVSLVGLRWSAATQSLVELLSSSLLEVPSTDLASANGTMRPDTT